MRETLIFKVIALFVYIFVGSVFVYYGVIETKYEGVTNVALFFIWFFAILKILQLYKMNEDDSANAKLQIQNILLRIKLQIFFYGWSLLIIFMLAYSGNFVLSSIYMLSWIVDTARVARKYTSTD